MAPRNSTKSAVLDEDETTTLTVVEDGDDSTESGDSAETKALKSKLRREAEREVIDDHIDEYHQKASAKFTAAGLEFKRKLTPTEKDAEKIKGMLAANPELRQLFPGLGPVVNSLSTSAAPQRVEHPEAEGTNAVE